MNIVAFRRWVLLPAMAMVALLGFVDASRSEAQGQAAPRNPATASEEAKKASPQEARLLRPLGDAEVYRHEETDKVRFLASPEGRSIGRPEGISATAPAKEAARGHLAKYGELFGVRDQARELEEERTEKAEKGRSVVRFQQVYKGVPVLAGELNVQVDDQNNLQVVTGEVLPGISLDILPGVDAQKAQDTAVDKVAKDHATKGSDLEATKPELWIYDPSLLGGPGLQKPTLVWRTDVAPKKEPAEFRELVLVDAKSGDVALNFNQVENARTRQTHTANNTETLPGTFVCGEADPTCSNGAADARSAHVYAGDTYDFYRAQHARDGINGLGMAMISSVNYGVDYQNAFWDSRQMVYGDGYAAADDVVGHELTHGVTEYESGLYYYYHSGAISEHFSDVWGEFVDLTNAKGNDTATVRWKLGEDLPIGAIRDMKNPQLFSEPDRMLSPYYTADLNDEDWGGVHTNSGVGNKAAYLMTDGGSFNGYAVRGLGITKVAKIYYKVQKDLLTSGGDYADLFATLQRSCTLQVGTAGITSADCAEVTKAVKATQMNLSPTAAPNPEAPVCNTGQRLTSTRFFDGMETKVAGNWRSMTVTGSNQWRYTTGYAASGMWALWSPNQDVSSNTAYASRNVLVPSSTATYLRFRHAYGFEDGTPANGDAGAYYDGAILEYSINNGSTWADAKSLFTHNGYKGTIKTGFGNPLAGRSAFVAESNGYISSRVNLSSLAGKNVQFRFRIGTDGSFGDEGWNVDEVRVYTCGV